ncbi:hypothetical protein BN128_1720 [Cronobacter sakazakii 696]|nr:hypothetical protein BN128_1720 [Cronobacter sakazakii 696]
MLNNGTFRTLLMQRFFRLCLCSCRFCNPSPQAGFLLSWFHASCSHRN